MTEYTSFDNLTPAMGTGLQANAPTVENYGTEVKYKSTQGFLTSSGMIPDINITGIVSASPTNTMFVTPIGNVFSGLGGVIGIDVKAGGLYTVTIPEDAQAWLTARIGEHGVSMYAAPNMTTAERTASITITLVADPTQTVTILLKQGTKASNGFAATPATIELSAAGGSADITLSISEAWQAETLNTWLRCWNADETKMQYSGYGDAKLKAVAGPNMTGVDRRATISFFDPGYQFIAVNVLQKALPYILSATSLEFTAAGGTKTIEVLPVSEDIVVPEVSVAATTGFTATVSNGVITVIAEANTTTDPVTGTLTVTSAEGGDPVTVTLTTAGTTSGS